MYPIKKLEKLLILSSFYYYITFYWVSFFLLNIKYSPTILIEYYKRDSLILVENKLTNPDAIT